MIGAVLKIALRALARNKGRSALTMLGIIIGVASVIAMVSWVKARSSRCSSRSRAWERTCSSSRREANERAACGAERAPARHSRRKIWKRFFGMRQR